LWSRPPAKLDVTEVEAEETDLSEVSLFDLLTFFKGALDRYRAAHPPTLEISHQRYSIKEKMEDMLARVRSGAGPVPLSDVFRGLAGRAEAIAVFLAVLELLRLRVVRARQAAEFGDILLESTGEDVALDGYEESYR
jgi:segregation and condensation protein A